jgi:hypothetical protein
MAKLIFLVGLVGSGKTRKRNQMQKNGFAFVDSVEHSDADGRKANYETLLNHLRAGRDCVAEERQAMFPAYRTAIVERLKTAFPDLEIEFWYFVNDPEKAARNVLSRPENAKNHKQHLRMIWLDSPRYVIPDEPGTVIFDIEEAAKDSTNPVQKEKHH